MLSRTRLDFSFSCSLFPVSMEFVLPFIIQSLKALLLRVETSSCLFKAQLSLPQQLKAFTLYFFLFSKRSSCKMMFFTNFSFIFIKICFSMHDNFHFTCGNLVSFCCVALCIHTYAHHLVDATAFHNFSTSSTVLYIC